MSTPFRAFRVSETGEGGYRHSVEQQLIDDLPEEGVLVRVRYSSLNYKDALSATIHKGITRHYPHTPGIDAAGEVVDSAHSEFREGDQVIVTSYDLGMNTPGGFGEYIRVPAEWIVPLPDGLSLRESMILGTAGFTAGLSIYRIQLVKGEPSKNTPMVLTGATGGVGSLGVSIANQLGYEVTAVTGKEDQHDWIKSLGATNVIDREDLPEDPEKPLLSGRWDAGFDTVGGNMLARIIKSVNIDGAVSCCGHVAGQKLSVSIYPFILRGISLLGVDSGNCPMSRRRKIWQKLSGSWKPENDHFNTISQEIGLDKLSEAIESIREGKMVGRFLIRL